ncbi:hypothetical protein V5799_022232 [Amblyomma americanum]|uniref:Uncharacterized protein n=1 Tax=Amblyomma americanum TaxID=6943 RepID=A0AAQ4FNF4_AMBAM
MRYTRRVPYAARPRCTRRRGGETARKKTRLALRNVVGRGSAPFRSPAEEATASRWIWLCRRGVGRRPVSWRVPKRRQSHRRRRRRCRAAAREIDRRHSPPRTSSSETGRRRNDDDSRAEYAWNAVFPPGSRFTPCLSEAPQSQAGHSVACTSALVTDERRSVNTDGGRRPGADCFVPACFLFDIRREGDAERVVWRQLSQFQLLAAIPVEALTPACPTSWCCERCDFRVPDYHRTLRKSSSL